MDARTNTRTNSGKQCSIQFELNPQQDKTDQWSAADGDGDPRAGLQLDGYVHGGHDVYRGCDDDCHGGDDCHGDWL